MIPIEECRDNAQPGRRFAANSSRGDHFLGAFGFLSHAFLFTAIGAGVCWADPEVSRSVCLVTGAVALGCLVVRGVMVGLSTTKESIRAIRNAWF